MQINIMTIAILCVSIVFVAYIAKRWKTTLEAVKANLFTLHAVLIAVIIDLIACGILSAWIFVNVQVLGNDVVLSGPSQTAMRGKK